MMYGMLLESVQHFVQTAHGEDAWLRVLEAANMQTIVFTTHKRYPEQTMLTLAQTCSDVIGVHTHDEWLHYFGQCFVEYFTHYGYDKILRVSGRHFRDLLHGLDNLHETMRFSYLKMVSPYFYVEHEDRMGCVLHYRSKRVGFTHYVSGQLQHCGIKFYGVKVMVHIISENVAPHGCHVVYRLNFDNSAFCASQTRTSFGCVGKYNSISGTTFFRVFPFAIVFNKSLTVTHAGNTLRRVMKAGQLIGQPVTKAFKLRRPIIDFVWENVLRFQSVVFELDTVNPVKLNYSSKLPSRSSTDADSLSSVTSESSTDEQSTSCSMYSEEGATRRLLLKGQMRYMEDLDGIAFLCSPILDNLEDMLELGLFINDLNMYDTSREMVMAGSQRASALEYSIEKQKDHSKKISENLQQLEEWREKSDSLLYSMIPKQIAVRLKQGEDHINTCQMFDEVTILFSYLLGFDEMCAELSPFQLVDCINSVFFVFDAIVDKYNVFKVETLGDAVYMVAGGVPEHRPDHAESIAHVALEFVHKVKHISVPRNKELQIRIGMHTGGVVAGVVGKRMPQYCLFGDTVNTASRMQTYGKPGLIHISESSQKCLSSSQFLTMLRGKLNVKGKGDMKTFWLVGHRSNPSTLLKRCLLRAEQNKSLDVQRTSFDESQGPQWRHVASERLISNLDEQSAVRYADVADEIPVHSREARDIDDVAASELYKQPTSDISVAPSSHNGTDLQHEWSLDGNADLISSEELCALRPDACVVESSIEPILPPLIPKNTHEKSSNIPELPSIALRVPTLTKSHVSVNGGLPVSSSSVFVDSRNNPMSMVNLSSAETRKVVSSPSRLDSSETTRCPLETTLDRIQVGTSEDRAAILPGSATDFFSTEDVMTDVRPRFSLTDSAESLSAHGVNSDHGSESADSSETDCDVTIRPREATRASSTDSVRNRVLDLMFEDIRSDLAAARKLRAESFARRASTGGGILLKDPKFLGAFSRATELDARDRSYGIVPGYMRGSTLQSKAMSHDDVTYLSTSCPHDSMTHLAGKEAANVSNSLQPESWFMQVPTSISAPCPLSQHVTLLPPYVANGDTQSASRGSNSYTDEPPKLCPFASH